MVFPRGFTSSSIRTSPAYICYCKADVERASELQKINLVSGEKPLPTSPSIRLLRDIMPDIYCDMVVQVVGVYTFPTNNNCMMLHVWDGTKPKLASFHPIPEHLSTAHRCHLNDIQVDNELISSIYVFDDHVPGILTLEAGRIIELRNLHVSAVKPSLMNTLKLAGNTYEKAIGDYMQLIIHSGTSYNRGITRLSPQSKQYIEFCNRIAALSTSADKSTPSVGNEISPSRKRARASEPVTSSFNDETELPVSRKERASTGSNLFIQSNRQPEEEQTTMQVESACVVAGPSNALDSSNRRRGDDDQDCNLSSDQEALTNYRSLTFENVIGLIERFCSR